MDLNWLKSIVSLGGSADVGQTWKLSIDLDDNGTNVNVFDDYEVIPDGRALSKVVLDWESDVDQQEILELSHNWITSRNFLTQRMVGLTRVGESSLTIEPLEETEDA